MTAEQLAQMFHETYERLAPGFGYKTREASAKPWSEVPEQNKSLMVAVAAEIVKPLAQRAEKAEEVTHWAQAVLTALNVGDIRSGSLLHLKLREVMIAYRNDEPAKEKA